MITRPQDALATLPHERYGEYLTLVYQRMAKHVPPNADIIEVCARPSAGDRGVISRQVIPHRTFVGVDRNPSRGEVVKDVLKDHIEADVIISGAILHHTPEAQIPQVLDHLHAPLLMFSGPNVDVLPDLFGDHQWHIDIKKLVGWLEERGYDVSYERIGLSDPLCEWLVIARKR